MNEQTEKLVNDALSSVIETVRATGNFVIEQAPDVIRQLILYNTINLAVWVGLGLVVLVATHIVVKKFLKWEATLDAYNSGGGIAGAVMSGVIGISLGFVLIFSNISELIKIIVAPKIWLLEYAASLVK